MSHYNKIKPYFYAGNDYTTEIIYQMVDNSFPLSSEGLQKSIEAIPLCAGKTEFFQKYKTRYIKIKVSQNMTATEIFNFGKRISIIEQKLIDKSKEFVDKTINLNISTTHINFINSMLFSLDSKIDGNKELKDRIKKYLKNTVKVIKSCKSKSKVK
jgi:hypothetical protein